MSNGLVKAVWIWREKGLPNGLLFESEVVVVGFSFELGFCMVFLLKEEKEEKQKGGMF